MRKPAYMTKLGFIGLVFWTHGGGDRSEWWYGQFNQRGEQVSIEGPFKDKGEALAVKRLMYARHRQMARKG